MGENYTYTSWRLSPCLKSEQFECVHCHTSSGRFRQKDDPNTACLPCHEQRVKNVSAHSHHPPDSPGNQCIACHMPKTEFARMVRSDHSMLPPTPAATIAFKSPNACNLCHTNKDAAWADKLVREWHKEDYQAPVLRRAGRWTPRARAIGRACRRSSPTWQPGPQRNFRRITYPTVGGVQRAAQMAGSSAGGRGFLAPGAGGVRRGLQTGPRRQVESRSDH